MKSDMRVMLTKRLLKEGLIRCLEEKELDRIRVSDLCAEAGVNRATFYNHYETPKQILSDIAQDHAAQLRSIYFDGLKERDDVFEASEACCEYLYAHKKEFRILFSENADHYLEQFAIEIVDRIAEENRKFPKKNGVDEDDYMLMMYSNAGGVYFFIRQWLAGDIKKTPHEVAELFRKIHIAHVFTDIM